MTRPKADRPPLSRSTAPRQVNPAAAALGVGIQPDKWTPAGIISALTTRYLQLIKLSEEERTLGDARKHRLHMAGAYELALVLAAYYQDMGDAEVYARWDRRSRQAGNVAYKRRNHVADTLGVGEAPDTTDHTSETEGEEE